MLINTIVDKIFIILIIIQYFLVLEVYIYTQNLNVHHHNNYFFVEHFFLIGTLQKYCEYQCRLKPQDLLTNFTIIVDR